MKNDLKVSVTIILILDVNQANLPMHKQCQYIIKNNALHIVCK